MKRPQLLLLGLLAVTVMVAFGVWSANSTAAPDASTGASLLATSAGAASNVSREAQVEPVQQIVSPQLPPSPDAVAEWSVAAFGADAAKRAAAIASLAQAPRALALPVLQRVLSDGEPQVDRPLALQALRELALTQGDADGAVRAAVREVIYHGDDESLAANAQDTLDTVEESEMK